MMPRIFCILAFLLVSFYAFQARAAEGADEETIALIEALSEARDEKEAALKQAEEETAPALLPAENTIEPVKNQSVTSVGKCLEQLPKEEAAAIRITSLKPYEECQKRLLKLREKAAAKEEEAETKAAEKAAPETYKNFVRVTGTAPAAEEGAAEKKPVRKTRKTAEQTR